MDVRSVSSAPAAATSSPGWRKILPFVVGLALVTFVIIRLDLRAFVRQLSQTNFVGLLVFAGVSTLSLMAADTLATVRVYRSILCPISYADFFTIRAASYLPSLLNYHVGQAWITYFLSKTYRGPIWRVAGATLVTYSTILGSLVLFGMVALPFNADGTPWLFAIVLPVSLLGVVYLGAIALKPRFLATFATTAVLLETGVRGHLVALAYRIPHMVVLFLATWIPFLFFDVRIPFSRALATIPIMMLVAALPITPQGVGTRDVLAIALFSKYVVGTAAERNAAVVAATLSWACALTLVQLAVSPIFMQRARRIMRGALSSGVALDGPSGGA